MIPAFYVVAARASSHPAMREAALLRLSAWLETQVAARVPGRPEQPTRIKRALDDEGLTLREALPPAALLAFADMEPGEPLRRTGRREKTLVNRVENYLAKQGREATEKENKLTGAPPPLGTAFEQSGSVPRAVPREVEQGEGFRKRIRPHLPDDVDLQDFELAEEARQQGDQLRHWIEEAELSKQERRVYELDMRTDYNTKVAARKLDIDDVTVRQYRKRYHDKIRKARRAAGF